MESKELEQLNQVDQEENSTTQIQDLFYSYNNQDYVISEQNETYQCNRTQKNQKYTYTTDFCKDAKEIQWRIDFQQLVKQFCIHKQNHYLSLNLTSQENIISRKITHLSCGGVCNSQLCPTLKLQKSQLTQEKILKSIGPVNSS